MDDFRDRLEGLLHEAAVYLRLVSCDIEPTGDGPRRVVRARALSIHRKGGALHEGREHCLNLAEDATPELAAERLVQRELNPP